MKVTALYTQCSQPLPNVSIMSCIFTVAVARCCHVLTRDDIEVHSMKNDSAQGPYAHAYSYASQSSFQGAHLYEKRNVARLMQAANPC